MDRLGRLLPTALAVLFLLAGCTVQSGRVTAPSGSATPVASPAAKAPEPQAASGTIVLDAAEASPVWQAPDRSASPLGGLWAAGLAYKTTNLGMKESVHALDREGRGLFHWEGPLYVKEGESAISVGVLAPNGMVAVHNRKENVIEVLDAQGTTVARPAVDGRVIIRWLNDGRHFLVTDFTSGAFPQLYTANGQLVGDLTPAGVAPRDVGAVVDPLLPWIVLTAGDQLWLLNEGRPFWQGQVPGAPNAVATTDGGQLWIQLDHQVLMLDQGRPVWTYSPDKQKRVRALLSPASGRTWLLAAETDAGYALELLGPDGALQGHWSLLSVRDVSLAGVSRAGDLVLLDVVDLGKHHLYGVDQTGKAVWHARGGLLGISADGRRVYVANDGGFMAFDL